MSRANEFIPRCPTCDLHATPGQNEKYLPFCSERCKLIDLGRWLNEEHAVTCEPSEEDDEHGMLDSDRYTDIDASEPRRAPPKLPPGWHDA